MAHASVLVGRGGADPQPTTGSISLVLGPMFSGKTSELLKRVRRHTARKQRCLLLKYKKDTRYSIESVVTTHDLAEMTAKAVELCQEAENLVWNFDVVAIDEGQFMPDIALFAEKWANDGKLVIIAALDGTFQRRPFPVVLQLLALAEAVEKLHAVCDGCGADASFTQRLGSESAVEVVGGKEKYRAVCRACHNGGAAHVASQRRWQSICAVSGSAEVSTPERLEEPPTVRLMRRLSLDTQPSPTASGCSPSAEAQASPQRSPSLPAPSTWRPPSRSPLSAERPSPSRFLNAVNIR